MFVRSNLREIGVGDAGGGIGQTPPPTEARDRLIGALVLIALIVLLILAILGADALVFNPLNASDAATQTYDAAHHAPGRGTLPPGHPRIFPPTVIPQNSKEHVV